VFPDPDHVPSFAPQLPCLKRIPFPVSQYLCRPELLPAFRAAVALWAAMPETSINEYCHFGFWETEVGPYNWFEYCSIAGSSLAKVLLFEFNCLVSSPAFDFFVSQQFCKTNLSPFIESPENTGHDFRAVRF